MACVIYKKSDTIKLTINATNDVNEWKGTKNIGGFNWCLKAERRNQVNGGKPKLDLFITVNEEDCNKLWMAEVNIAFQVSQQYCRYRIPKDGCIFHNGSCFELNDVFFIWNLNHAEQTVLEVEINVLPGKSKHGLMSLDTDLRLLYPGQAKNGEQITVDKVIAVNKYALASNSDYFRNLFFGNWSEHRTMDANDTFTIHEDADFDIRAFSKMIYTPMAVGRMWMLNSSKIFTIVEQDQQNSKDLDDLMAMKILKLSVKYDIPMMLDYAETYLLSQLEQHDFPKIELLEVADELGLQKLKEQTVKSIYSVRQNSYGVNYIPYYNKLWEYYLDGRPLGEVWATSG